MLLVDESKNVFYLCVQTHNEQLDDLVWKFNMLNAGLVLSLSYLVHLSRGWSWWDLLVSGHGCVCICDQGELKEEETFFRTILMFQTQ